MAEAKKGGVFGCKASNTLPGRYGTEPVARQASGMFRRIVIRVCWQYLRNCLLLMRTALNTDPLLIYTVCLTRPMAQI